MDMSGGSMSGNSMSNSTMTSMTEMIMTFYTSSSTPLYSTGWTPSSTSGYAGTCIFLIVLATLFRFLLAAKTWKEDAWLEAEFNRRYINVPGKLPVTQRMAQDADKKHMILTENGVEENVVVVQKRGMDVRPWRISVDPMRALMDTVIVGISYLLMLAVMTMNVGYFLSVLGGTFLGSILIGRYAIHFAH
ncbi:MAG: hypothetical protein M1818_006794 [Claussenomyces sp. TS43310]|nr:MAG: hypothetical protein M1818_006794 [Claussenomyces sp. TS43310]